MQSWIFQNMTDLWGDIPYSEALKGDVVGGPLKPKYDTQKDIYYGLLKTLTDASTAMKAGRNDPGLGGADPIYKGDIAKWLKFSNSLRARMAMRMSKADPAKATAELSAAFSAPGGVMTSNADNAMLVWPGDGVFDNPWAANFAGARRSSHVQDAARHDERAERSAHDDLRAADEGRSDQVRRSAERPGQRHGHAVLQHHVAAGRDFLSGRHGVRHVRHGGGQEDAVVHHDLRRGVVHSGRSRQSE